MNGNMVRTTIKLPVRLHRQLRLAALGRGVSISDLIVEKVNPKRTKSVEEVLQLFDRIRKNGPQFSAAEVVREERDSH